MPRADNNRSLWAGTAPEAGNFAAVLTSDPFGSPCDLLHRLSERGYVGVTNWPSTILLEGQTKQWMATIPATPELEFDWLAGAQKRGFETLAFFRSLDQGRSALKAGLRQLVLHPGLIPQNEMGSKDLLIASFRGLIEKLYRMEPSAKILIYDHVGLGSMITTRDLNAHGVVTYEPGP